MVEGEDGGLTEYRHTFRESGFGYLDIDYGIKLPQLVLGIKALGEVNPVAKYNFYDKYKFLKIVHQTAGIGCHQHYLQGMVLDVHTKLREGMEQIDNKWLESNTGVFGDTTLVEILEYRADLKRLLWDEADCNHSFRDFEEGLYPIDLNPTILKKLSKQRLPNDLDKLIDWERMEGNIHINKVAGILNRWHLWILGNNSD